MDELLKKLIQKGRKPFNVETSVKVCKFFYGFGEWYVIYDGKNADIERTYKLREIVSIESGLWQFVTENKLTKISKTSGKNEWSQKARCKHWILKCALLQLSEIEGFLLDNIKI